MIRVRLEQLRGPAPVYWKNTVVWEGTNKLVAKIILYWTYFFHVGPLDAVYLETPK